MKHLSRSMAASALLAVLLASTTVQAQYVAKLGLTRYDTHSRTTGITGVGLPAGADARTGDATTVIAVVERELWPNIGLELVLGVPPKIKAQATGSVAFLGEVMTSRNVAPTLLLNYHFGQAGDRWRPYVGAGINYTRFTQIRNPFGWKVSLSDSVGPVAQAGIDYALSPRWGLFASVAVLKVETDLVASGASVLQTTIDFRPVVYSAGLAYRF